MPHLFSLAQALDSAYKALLCSPEGEQALSSLIEKFNPAAEPISTENRNKIWRLIDGEYRAFCHSVKLPSVLVPWLIDRNSDLLNQYKEDEIGVRILHELYRAQLWAYHVALGRINVPSVAQESNFFMDTVLLREYRFETILFAKKRLMPMTNLMFLKTTKYNESFYDLYCNKVTQIFSGADDAAYLRADSDDIIGAGSLSSSHYCRDPDFLAIVHHHMSLRSIAPLAVGVSEEKGGLSTIAHIILDGMGCFRFLGRLSSNPDRSQSPFSHGPYFILFDEQKKPSPSGEVYNIAVSDLTILVPSKDDRAKINFFLRWAVSHSLLPESALTKLQGQVKDYRSYCVEIGLSPVQEGIRRAKSSTPASPNSDGTMSDAVSIWNSDSNPSGGWATRSSRNIFWSRQPSGLLLCDAQKVASADGTSVEPSSQLNAS